MQARASFEVQIFHDGRWLLEDYCDTEVTARAAAKSRSMKSGCQGVRILRNWTRADGVVTTQVIHSQRRAPEPARVGIVPIESAPFCNKTSDFYRFESRSTIGRICRRYVEQMFITPTELMHNYKALRRLQDVETLFVPAVDRVASLQARDAKMDAKLRRDQLYGAIAKLTDRARKADTHPNLPALVGSDFGKLVARIESLAQPGDADFFSLVVLSRDLIGRRSWLHKLQRLVELAQSQSGDKPLSLLDGVLADLLAVPTALQDVLGQQRNLAEALCSMIDLSEGRLGQTTGDAQAQITAIAPLLAEGRLGETRKSLMRTVTRQLSSQHALCRDDRARERDAFRRVARRLFRPGGLMGGVETAEALTRRSLAFQEEGGQAGLRKAVLGVTDSMGDSQFSVVYLLDLAGSKLGAELSGEILRHLTALMSGDLDQLVPRLPVRERLTRATQIYELIAAAVSIDDAGRAQILTALDEMLSRYLQREAIIDKLDDPAAPLRDRATRLIAFCAARVLPLESKAHKLARERSIALLRQPNFEVQFVEGLEDQAQRDQSLRSFYALLARAGLR